MQCKQNNSMNELKSKTNIKLKKEIKLPWFSAVSEFPCEILALFCEAGNRKYNSMFYRVFFTELHPFALKHV